MLGRYERMRTAATIAGAVLIFVGLAVGFWPEHATVDGQSHPCPVAILTAFKTHAPSYDDPNRPVHFACNDHARNPLRVTSGLGILAVALLAVPTLTSFRRRKTVVPTNEV